MRVGVTSPSGVQHFAKKASARSPDRQNVTRGGAGNGVSPGALAPAATLVQKAPCQPRCAPSASEATKDRTSATGLPSPISLTMAEPTTQPSATLAMAWA